MPGKAARVTATTTMYKMMQQLANSRMMPQSIAVRMQVVLLAMDRLSNFEISKTVQLCRQQVGLWRRR